MKRFLMVFLFICAVSMLYSTNWVDYAGVLDGNDWFIRWNPSQPRIVLTVKNGENIIASAVFIYVERHSEQYGWWYEVFNAASGEDTNTAIQFFGGMAKLRWYADYRDLTRYSDFLRVNQ
jgi:hypothetical protein